MRGLDVSMLGPDYPNPLIEGLYLILFIGRNGQLYVITLIGPRKGFSSKEWRTCDEKIIPS